MIEIDRNRINFNDLGIEPTKETAWLFEPLKNISTKTAADYKNVPVDVNSPENAEPLIDVRKFGIKSVPYYATEAINCPTYQKHIWNAPHINYVRQGIGERLVKVNEILDALGLELVVVDAHRSPRTQNILFKAFVKKAYEEGFTGKDAINWALKFCSRADKFDPQDSKTWSLHSSGATVDCYLLDKKTQRVVDMGEQHFDRAAKETRMDYYEKLAERQPLTREQQGFLAARRIFTNVMTHIGGAIYGDECWHVSLFDQYWGLLNHKPALYGYKQSPRDTTADYIREEEKKTPDLIKAFGKVNQERGLHSR